MGLLRGGIWTMCQSAQAGAFQHPVAFYCFLGCVTKLARSRSVQRDAIGSFALLQAPFFFLGIILIGNAKLLLSFS